MALLWALIEGTGLRAYTDGPEQAMASAKPNVEIRTGFPPCGSSDQSPPGPDANADTLRQIGAPSNNGPMPRLELFPFRYRDPRTGKWVRARHRAERHEIAERYGEWEIIAPAEIRDVDEDTRYFTPHRSPLDAELRRYSERPPELRPAIDAVEAFLLAVFLRRYITYCARRRRYAAMNGAALLYCDLRFGGYVETTSPAGAGPVSARNRLLLAPREADAREAET